jgi:branched-chain amino acid transport system substrate-binding protein
MKRDFVAAATLALAASFVMSSSAMAQQPATGPLRLGVMLPYKGVYAALSEGVDRGHQIAIEEFGGKIAGREIQLLKEDTENSNPTVSVQKANRLIRSERVSAVLGVVSSGVGIALREVAHRERVPLILALSVADQITNELCSPYVARTSFAATTLTGAAGRYWAAQGIKTAVTLGPDYAAGHQMIAGFKQGFQEGGGKVLEELWSAFRQTRDWGPLLTKARQSGAQIIYSFYGGSESVQTVRQHSEFGMQKTVPLRGNMWLFDETLWNAMGDSVIGATYDTINIPDLPHEANKKFVAAFRAKYGMDPDINAVLGYENMKPYLMALDKNQGDAADGAKVLKTMASLEWDAPRGKFKMDPKNNNAILTDVYIARIEKGQDGKLRQVLVDTTPGRPGPNDKCKM